MNAAISKFLASAGSILTAGISAVEDAKALVALMEDVLQVGTDPTDDQWTQLHAYEATQTAALDAKMDGEV